MVTVRIESKLAIKSLLWIIGLGLLLTVPVNAQAPAAGSVYYFRDGQAVSVARRGVLAGDPRADATTLLESLLAGPTEAEEASGLVSPLPSGTQLAAVTTAGADVTVDLRLPQAFLDHDLDVYLCDAIVDQIAKTLHPLGLHNIHIRVETQDQEFATISDFLPQPGWIAPVIPANDDEAPDRTRTAPEVAGQPPALGQGQPQGSLAGKTVWLSAGHGWYWSTILSRWNSQRPNTYGIVEDFANAEAVNYYLARYLWNAGADVWLVRERSMNEHEVIVDNDAGAPAYTETGSWYLGSTPGYNNSAYRYAIAGSGMASTATYTPDLPQAGWYAVWAWYLHGSNRPTDVRYEIHHAGGMTPVQISQEVHGQTWRYLGEYYFEAGPAGRVTILSTSDDIGQAVVADAVRFGGGLGSITAPGGPSGEPRWEEAASTWVQYQGAPSWISDDDVTARPLYAEWETAKGYPAEAGNAVYVSWHTNAGGGTGTNSYIHDTRLPAGSPELQDWVHAELVQDLKSAWNPAWTDRGQKSANFGEVRELTNIPGILLEVAFHDTEDPGDADDLREPLFRQIAARAVYQGIAKYFAGRDGSATHLSPEPPLRLAARNTGPGQVTLQWAPPPCCDGVIGDAATAYKVYHSTNGRGFDNGTETTSTSLAISGFAPGTLHFFRVSALNQGGESFPTPVVAVRTPAEGESIPLLVVDGFDRLDQSALIPQWESSALGTARRMFLERMNRYDYAVEHGQALNTCGRAFDGAVNDALIAGNVSLSNYAAVDWFVGEDSEADLALSDPERALLSAYLDGGGRLLISGSDIGYDLVSKGRDPAFYRDYLRAETLGSDANTYTFGGEPGSPLAGLSGSFDDGSSHSYNVDSPDRLQAIDGSSPILAYTGGSGDTAAVAYSGEFRMVYVGFPLETVTDPTTRADLLCTAIDYLLPPQVAGVDLAPGQGGLAEPGRVAIYAHVLTNTGNGPDTFDISSLSSQGWTTEHPPSIALGAGLTTTLVVSLTVAPDAPVGTIDTCTIMATSRLDPTVSEAAVDTTKVVPISTPRLINPGFEAGTEQTAWQASVTDIAQVFVHLDDLPPDVETYSGEWLARLGPQADTQSLGTQGLSISSTMTITQEVALPSAEPTATLSLAWYSHARSISAPVTDTLTVSLFGTEGGLLTNLLTVTNSTGSPPGEGWQEETFDLSAYSGQTVQLAFRAVASETDFYIDDVSLTTEGPPGPVEFRALWVDAYHDGIKNRQQIDELIETAQAGNFNTIVVQIRRRGDTYYPSALDPWAPDADPTFDALATVIKQAHAAGIEVHAWATTLALWDGNAPPEALLHTYNQHGPGSMGRDFWLMTRDDGAEQTSDQASFLDPGHPDVVAYTVAVYTELVSRYKFDGLHLDRIRYPWSDWGYNPTSLDRFRAQTGRSDTPAPQDEQWLQWRRDQVTALLREIYLSVMAINPRLRVSAAVSASGDAPMDGKGWTASIPYSQHMQDWHHWLQEGILDLALPMLYRDEDTSAAQFDGWLAWAREHQYNRAVVVGTGLYLNDVSDSMAQWLRVRQPCPTASRHWGTSGYSYATPSDAGTSQRDFVNAAVTRVFTQPALPPVLPWRDSPSMGHIMGSITPTLPCLPSLDNVHLTLTGPQTRAMVTGEGGWFGAVDLLPGEYALAVEGLSFSQPLTIIAGKLAIHEITVAGCPSLSRSIYLPLVMKSTHP